MQLNNLQEFCQYYQQGKNFIITKELNADLETPVALYKKLVKLSPYSLLFESAEKDKHKGRYSAIALKPDLIWECKDFTVTIKNQTKQLSQAKLAAPEIKKSLEDFISKAKLSEDEKLPAIASGIFGYMSYDMVKYFDDINLPEHDEIDIADAIFIRPTILLVCDNLTDSLTICLPIWHDKQGEAADIFQQKQTELAEICTLLSKAASCSKADREAADVEFSSNYTEAEFCQKVELAKQYIKAGDVFQVLPSRRFKAKFATEGLALYRALRKLNPSPFLFYLHFKDFEIIGSSPEIMVRVAQDEVTIRPLAGTRKRGLNEAEDQALAEDLLADQKEVAEHLMLIDLGRNDVGRVSAENSVKVTKYMEIEYYSHVMHISSTVTGQLAADKSCLDSLIAGFPAGTVSGAPKIRAMEIISELETVRRSFYSGCVGYFSLHQKHMDMAIMLRTSLIKDGYLYGQSGAGIVHDSVPQSEFEETENKFRIIRKAAELAKQFS